MSHGCGLIEKRFYRSQNECRLLFYLSLSTIIVRANLRKGGIIAQQSQSQRYYCKLFSSVSILRLALQASRRCSSTSKNMPFSYVEDALLRPRKASSSTQPITFWFLEDYELNDYAHTSILQTSYSLCFVMIFHNDVNCLDDTKTTSSTHIHVHGYDN